MTRLTWLALLLASGCTCTESHQPPADGSVPDGGSDDAGGEECLPWAPGMLPDPGGVETSCTPERLHECAVAVARLAEGLGEPVTTCFEDSRGCAMIDACDERRIICTCGDDPPCQPGSVCVRSAPGERPRCADICLHDGPIARECASRSGPVPPARINSGGYCREDDELAREQCRHWAQLFATTGYAHGTCGVNSNGFIFCGMGDTCGPGDSPDRLRCDCAGAECALDEVCVSDTPDGPPRCVPACLPPL